jgi:protein-tyrosine phosphatase
MKITKILMVCLGNICRSPLAEGILQSKLDSSFFIDSAGTSNWHVGNAPDIRSIAIAKKKGVNISNQKSRQFVREDFQNFDVIYAMDQDNYINIIALAKSNSDKEKVKLILDELSITNKNVPDPYYGGDKGFENVFDMLDKACNNIAHNLNKK